MEVQRQSRKSYERPYLKKTLHKKKKRLVDWWPKVQALSSSPSTQFKRINEILKLSFSM
jgi:hypothetical protein